MPSLHDFNLLVYILIGVPVALSGLWISQLGGTGLTVLGAAIFAIAGTFTTLALYDQAVIIHRYVKNNCMRRRITV